MVLSNAERQKRYRQKQRSSKTVTKRNAPVTDSNENVTPLLPANFGQSDCQCKMCQTNSRRKDKLIINHGPYKPASQLQANEVNRVSLPGDVDYKGVAKIA